MSENQPAPKAHKLRNLVVLPLAAAAAITLVTLAATGALSATPEVPAAASSPTTSEPSTPPATSDTDGDSKYIAAVEGSGVFPDAGEDESQLAGIGHAVCSALDRGASVDVLISTGGGDYTAQQMGTIIGAAVVYICPEHKQEVLDQAQSAVTGS